MMSLTTWAVVPVKSLNQAKQRLAGTLGVSERRSLSLAMLSDVLETLQRVDALDGIAVLSRDARVIDLATRHGVRILTETEMGLNAALGEAAQTLDTEGCKTMLIVPADVPLATPAEFGRILQAQDDGCAVTLVADRRGSGTNALACSPPQAIRPCFGRHSLKNHLHAAQRAGLTTTVLNLPGVGLDIDVPNDLTSLVARPGRSYTHDCLHAILGDRPYAARQRPAATGRRRRQSRCQ